MRRNFRHEDCNILEKSEFLLNLRHVSLRQERSLPQALEDSG